jgi:hypothetical protein
MRVRRKEADDEEEQVHGREDHSDFARAGGWLGDGGGLLTQMSALPFGRS